MRYAGIDITKEKKPAHADSVVLDESDQKKLRNWFSAQPFSPKEPEGAPLLEVKNLSFGYNKGQQTLKNVKITLINMKILHITDLKKLCFQNFHLYVE